MAKMNIEKRDRPRVKVECLRLLATLKLDPARTRLISGFIDTYLHLNAQETQIFQTELDKLEPQQQEGVMQIVTSWMEEGIERGITQGERSLILRQLTRRLGDLPEVLRSQIDTLSLPQLERLGEALLDFSNLTDLSNWLATENSG